MSNAWKERRCKSCGKLLLDETLPFCRRCVLEGRNKVGKIGGIVGGFGGGLVFLKSGVYRRKG